MNSDIMQPDKALRRLEKLVGEWTLIGRSLQATEDDITGITSFEWILDGFFLLHRGMIQAGDIKIPSLAIIGYDPETDTFPEFVYGNMGSLPLSYGWQINGDDITHWTNGSKYTGKFIADGKIVAGGWRADGAEMTPANTYEATMYKVE